MPTTTESEPEVGRVTTHAKIENIGDLFEVAKGRLKPEDVRTVEVDDALVDTGCTVMGLPTRFINQLGLTLKRTKQALAMTGLTQAKIYGTIQLTIDGRECPLDVMEVPDECPVVIGQIPLEYMDFVVDPRQQKLIGNPAHNGEQMYEMM